MGKQGALEALANSRPGRPRNGQDPELAAAKAEIVRLSEALKEMAVTVTLGGKGRAGGR
jgi:hypothetical protein